MCVGGEGRKTIDITIVGFETSTIALTMHRSAPPGFNQHSPSRFHGTEYVKSLKTSSSALIGEPIKMQSYLGRQRQLEEGKRMAKTEAGHEESEPSKRLRKKKKKEGCDDSGELRMLQVQVEFYQKKMLALEKETAEQRNEAMEALARSKSLVTEYDKKQAEAAKNLDGQVVHKEFFDKMLFQIMSTATKNVDTLGTLGLHLKLMAVEMRKIGENKPSRPQNTQDAFDLDEDEDDEDEDVEVLFSSERSEQISSNMNRVEATTSEMCRLSRELLKLARSMKAERSSFVPISRLEEQIQQAADQLNSELDEMEKRNERRVREITEKLGHDNAELKKKIDALGKEIREKKKEISQLNKEAMAQRTGSQAAQNKLQQRIDDLEQELATCRLDFAEENAHAVEASREAESERKRWDDERSELSRKLESALVRATSCDEKCQALETELLKSKAAEKKYLEDLASMQQLHNKEKSFENERNLEKERHARELKEVESKLKDKEKELDIVRKELESARTALTKSHDSCDNSAGLRADLSAALDELEKVKDEVARVRRENDKLARRADNLPAESQISESKALELEASKPENIRGREKYFQTNSAIATAREMTALFRYTQCHQSKVVELWHNLDTDGNGTLSLKEWCEGMTNLISNVPGLGVSEETLILAFSEVDTNNNRELDWDEFSELFKGSDYIPISPDCDDADIVIEGRHSDEEANQEHADTKHNGEIYLAKNPSHSNVEVGEGGEALESNPQPAKSNHSANVSQGMKASNVNKCWEKGSQTDFRDVDEKSGSKILALESKIDALTMKLKARKHSAENREQVMELKKELVKERKEAAIRESRLQKLKISEASRWEDMYREQGSRLKASGEALHASKSKILELQAKLDERASLLEQSEEAESRPSCATTASQTVENSYSNSKTNTAASLDQKTSSHLEEHILLENKAREQRILALSDILELISKDVDSLSIGAVVNAASRVGESDTSLEARSLRSYRTGIIRVQMNLVKAAQLVHSEYRSNNLSSRNYSSSPSSRRIRYSGAGGPLNSSSSSSSSRSKHNGTLPPAWRSPTRGVKSGAHNPVRHPQTFDCVGVAHTVGTKSPIVSSRGVMQWNNAFGSTQNHHGRSGLPRSTWGNTIAQSIQVISHGGMSIDSSARMRHRPASAGSFRRSDSHNASSRLDGSTNPSSKTMPRPASASPGPRPKLNSPANAKKSLDRETRYAEQLNQRRREMASSIMRKNRKARHTISICNLKLHGNATTWQEQVEAEAIYGQVGLDRRQVDLQVAAAGGGIVGKNDFGSGDVVNSTRYGDGPESGNESFHHEVERLQERRRMLLESTSRISPVKTRIQQVQSLKSRQQQRQRPQSAATYRQESRSYSSKRKEETARAIPKRKVAREAKRGHESVIPNPIEPWSSSDEPEPLECRDLASGMKNGLWGESILSPSGVNRGKSLRDDNGNISQEGQKIVQSYYKSHG